MSSSVWCRRGVNGNWLVYTGKTKGCEFPKKSLMSKIWKVRFIELVCYLNKRGGSDKDENEYFEES